ncbi:hypothetical protein B0H11DRAFT_1798820 [Mycena galericulata]|nr:hypothetical protein B0H11DRAFT_1798820 [Mycena galericulata]
MIIDDVNDRTSLKGSRSPPSPHDSFEPGLPPSPPPYVSYQAIPSPVVAATRKIRRRKHRFRRKYLVAASVVLNCFLVVLLLRVIRRRKADDPSGSREQLPPVGNAPERKPRVIKAVVPDSHLGRCTMSATWSNATRLAAEEDFPFSSDASFQFPDSSSPMFLLSQGALSGGTINVVPSSERVPHALLSVRYHSASVRDRANVCWMERKYSNAAGIGVFTPAPFDGQAPTDRLEFTITLFLPTNHSSITSLPIYNLETNLPSFTHSFDSLRGLLEFDNLVVRSQNGAIASGSLFARNATIHTSNAFISGSFDVTTSLSLITSNAPIDASVNLHNRNIFATTELVLQTRNAQIDSAVSLLTSAASGEGGKFAVTAQNSDGPLIMTFPASPARSVLDLNAQTSNSPANVWLNSHFEGEFALASSMVLVDRRPFLDPRRLRSVFYSDYKNGMVVGAVRWKMPIFKSKPVQGLVRVTTTNDILKLFV